MDNGLLDCLREITPPHGIEESDSELNLRLAAQWDSDCSFEISDANFKLVKKTFGITSFVNHKGELTDEDDDQQADMCELVRAAFHADKFGEKGTYGTLDKIDKNFLMKLDCAGKGDVTQPCAYTDGGFWDQDSWTILYQSAGLRIRKDNKDYPDF